MSNRILENSVALIPGAARPIGRAIAREFGRRGASLVLPLYDWQESIQEMKQEFDQKGYKTTYMVCDLRDEKVVKELSKKVKKQFGKLDYLINNIERGGMPIVHGSYDLEVNKEQWDLEISTTLKAKWLLFHHCLPLLKESDSSSVVNISSIAAQLGRSGPGALFFNDAYSAANRAISSFTETWAREGAPSIRVNELRLGLINSRHGENTRGWAEMSKEEKELLIAHTLLNRTGNPEEVAEAVFFLAHRATYMTGSVLTMDGGYLLGGEKSAPYPKGLLENS